MLFFNRKYKSGSGFALWRWKDIETDGDLYLRRLIIAQVPKVGSVMLHWIMRPDLSRDLHDHPVSFLSVVLRGSYWELVPVTDPEVPGLKLRHIRWLNFKRATDAHRIRDVFGKRGVLTLVFAGPNRRKWGFFTAEGWVPWTEYKGDN